MIKQSLSDHDRLKREIVVSSSSFTTIPWSWGFILVLISPHVSLQLFSDKNHILPLSINDITHESILNHHRVIRKLWFDKIIPYTNVREIVTLASSVSRKKLKKCQGFYFFLVTSRLVKKVGHTRWLASRRRLNFEFVDIRGCWREANKQGKRK